MGITFVGSGAEDESVSVYQLLRPLKCSLSSFDHDSKLLKSAFVDVWDQNEVISLTITCNL